MGKLDEFKLRGPARLRLCGTARSRGKGAHTRATLSSVRCCLTDTTLTFNALDREIVYPVNATAVVKLDSNRIDLFNENERYWVYFNETVLATVFYDALRRRILRSLQESKHFRSKEETTISLVGTVFSSDAFNQSLTNGELDVDCVMKLEGVSKSFFRIFAHNPTHWENVEIKTLRQAAMITAYHGELLRKCIVATHCGIHHRSYLRDLSFYCRNLVELQLTLTDGEFLDAVVPWMPFSLKRLSIMGGRLQRNQMASAIVDKLPSDLCSFHVSSESGLMNLLLVTGIHSTRADLIFTSIINCFGGNFLPVYTVQTTLRVIISCIYSLWQTRCDLTHLAIWALGTTLSSSSFSDPAIELLIEANDLILRALEDSTDADVLRLGTYSIFLVFRRSLLQQPKGKAVVETAVRESRVIEILAKLALMDDCVVQRNAICILDLVAYAGIEAWGSRHASTVAKVATEILHKFPSYHGDLNRPSMEHLHAHQILQRLQLFYPVLVPSLPCQRLEKQKMQWLKSLKPQDVIDAMDTEQAAWYESFVVEVDKKRGIQVHFLGWNPSWRRWIPYDEPFRVQKRNVIVPPWRPKLRVDDKIDVKLPLAQLASRKQAMFSHHTISIPKCTPICTLEEEGEQSLRPRWKTAHISTIEVHKDHLVAKVVVKGMPTVPPHMPDMATTFGRLLDMGFSIEFWVDLNGNGVMPYGTHTQKLSTRRPVWGFLPAPKLPHVEHIVKHRWEPTECMIVEC